MNLDQSFFWMTREEEACVLQSFNRVLTFPIPMRITRRLGISYFEIKHTIEKGEVLVLAFDENIRTPRQLLQYVCNVKLIKSQLVSPAGIFRMQCAEALRQSYTENDFATLTVKKECPVCYEEPIQGFTARCGHRVCVCCWTKLTRCPLCREPYFDPEEPEEFIMNSDNEDSALL